MVRKVHMRECALRDRSERKRQLWRERATAQRVTSIGEGDRVIVVHNMGVGVPAANAGTYRGEDADVEVE